MKTQTQGTGITPSKQASSRLGQRWSWLLCLIFCMAAAANAAQKKVLFYGSTHQSGGVGEKLVNNTPSEFYPIGQGSDIWTPGNANAAKDWSKKTTADFQAFDAIVIGDLYPDTLNIPSRWAGAIANRIIWSAAITGNILLYGEDPEYHAPAQPGAIEIIQQGIRFAADDPAAGPGLFITFSIIDPALPSPVDPSQPCTAHLLSGLGSFSLIAANNDAVRKTYSNPFIDCLTEFELSDWLQSSHSGFLSWPTGYIPLAMVTDVPPEKRTPGYEGLVHLIGKGTFKQFFLTPVTAGRIVGQQHTVTATYLSETGAGISGVTVTFTITAGPNSSQNATRTTDANGNAIWTYTGSGGAGRDTIQATATVSGCPPTARAFVCWSDQIVTISATDPNAVEPPTQGGNPDNGTFVLTRSGNTSQGLTVTLSAGGTAIQGVDYDLISIPVFFDAGVVSVNLSVVPLFDTLSEVPETVIVQVLEGPNCVYAVGTPSEATVIITSAQLATVTITVVDGTLDESGNNPGTLRLSRTYLAGDLPVSLSFSGVASFGADYQVGLPDFSGVATIPDGSSFLDIPIWPVPDSRAEGNETLTVTVLPSPQGNYAVGTPSSQTITILDDDSNQIPLNGWTLTDVTPPYVTSAYSSGINTLPDGSGGWRGQAVGYSFGYYGNTQTNLAFKWNNGSRSLLYWPSGWFFNAPSSSAWAAAASINDACTIVGYVGGYYINMQYGYYQRPGFWRVNQTYATELSVLAPSAANPLNNSATDINQRDDLNGTGGVIVGNNHTANDKDHAVAWIPDANGSYGSVTDLQDIGNGSQFSYTSAINNNGVVVGKGQALNMNNYHAFRSRSANLLPLTLSGQTTRARRPLWMRTQARAMTSTISAKWSAHPIVLPASIAPSTRRR